jgi:hypothetical protein
MFTALTAAALPLVKTLAYVLASTLFGIACSYIRKKTKIELTEKQEKQIWELAKRYVFQVEEKSARLKKLGASFSSKAKADEATSNLARSAGISVRDAQSFVDGVLGETGIAAAGKKKEKK